MVVPSVRMPTTPTPRVQGDFDLRPSASSNDKSLFYGVITCSLGARYKSYCANIGRTYVINPSKGMEKLCARVLVAHD